MPWNERPYLALAYVRYCYWNWQTKVFMPHHFRVGFSITKLAKSWGLLSKRANRGSASSARIRALTFCSQFVPDGFFVTKRPGRLRKYLFPGDHNSHDIRWSGTSLLSLRFRTSLFSYVSIFYFSKPPPLQQNREYINLSARFFFVHIHTANVTNSLLFNLIFSACQRI